MAATPQQRAVFLDRDGTLNVEKEYLYQPEAFEFIPGAPEAVRLLRDGGYKVIVVTNQSGVARGYFGPRQVEALHRHIQTLLKPFGTRIDAFYYCPHHPTQGQGEYRVECDCRKGQPGMLLKAAREHHLALDRSYMIGDKAADIEAGARAGCHAILVATGYGCTEAQAASLWHPWQATDLLAAARMICATPENLPIP